MTKALILIDLQELDTDPSVGALATKNETEKQAYLDEIWGRVVPCGVKALQLARRAGVEIIHVRIQSLTHDGRDRSPAHKRLGLHVAPGSVHGRFLRGLEPQDDEIILDKTTSDAFHSTNLAYLLRNLEVQQLFVMGVLTHECVASTVRSGSDLGYEVFVIADGCAASTPGEHISALETLDGRYAQVIQLEDFRGLSGITDDLPEG